MTEATVRGVEVPIRLVQSHAIASPGFQSRRKAWLAHPDGTDFAATPFELRGQVVLGELLDRLAVRRRDPDWHLLEVDFVAPRSIAEAQDFVQQLSDALTVQMAPDQKDPWYGNLYVEVNWAGFSDVTPKSPNTLTVSGSVGMTSQQWVPLSDAKVLDLTWSPLSELFADGMRAGQPKSKYLYWFVILEELEKRKAFHPLFNRLFDDAARAAILAAAPTASHPRLKGLLSDPLATAEGRAQKLFAVLTHIGITEVETYDGRHTIDETICQALIKQRNTVAHKGGAIDKDLLYLKLFPLAQSVLAYLNAQDD